MRRLARIIPVAAGLSAALLAWPLLASAQRAADQQPQISQSDIVVAATAGFGSTFSADVTITPSVSDPDDATSTLTVSCDTANGSMFLAGTTNVTCHVADPAGMRNSVTFTVTVTVPGPSFNAPAPISVPATSSAGAVATWADVTATDVGGQSDTVSCDHLSGITYPVGTTTVTCSASVIRHDSVGNVINWASGQTQFTVTVTPQATGGSSAGSTSGSSGGSTSGSSGSGSTSGSGGSSGSSGAGSGSSSAGTSSGSTSSGSSGGSSPSGPTSPVSSGSASSGSSQPATTKAPLRMQLTRARVSRSGKGKTVAFGVELTRAAVLHVVIVTAGGKTVTRFSLTGHQGLNKLSAFVPPAAATGALVLKVIVSGQGQLHTVAERIGARRVR